MNILDRAFYRIDLSQRSLALVEFSQVIHSSLISDFLFDEKMYGNSKILSAFGPSDKRRN